MGSQRFFSALYLGIILYIALHIGVYVSVYSELNHYDSSALEKWKVFLDEPVDFPFKDNDYKKISGTFQDTLLEAQSLLEHCQTLGIVQTDQQLLSLNAKSQPNGRQNPSLDTEHSRLLTDYKKCSAAIGNVAEQIRRKCVEDDGVHFSNLQDYLDIQLATDFLCCKSDALVANENYEEALQAAANAAWIHVAYVPHSTIEYTNLLNARERIVASFESLVYLSGSLEIKQSVLDVMLDMERFYDRRIAKMAAPLSIAAVAETSNLPLPISENENAITGFDYMNIIVPKQYPPLGAYSAVTGMWKSIQYDIPDNYPYRNYKHEFFRSITMTKDIEKLLYFDWWCHGGPLFHIEKEEKITVKFNNLKIELASELGVPAAGSNDLQTP